jgi:alkylation response protein AidB-like acyl-CoA dehydrogenase
VEFEYTEEQQVLSESLRKFLDGEMRPWDDRYGDEEMTADRAKTLLRMLIPWGYLGADALHDPIVRGIQMEELSRVFPGLAGIAYIANAAAQGVAVGAHPDVAERLAGPLARAERIGCMGISEPNVGSDPSGIECRAELRGDRYVVNGTKTWISNGHIADVVIALVQTDPSQGPAALRQLVIDRRESPFESRDTPTIGVRSFPTSELYFRDVEVPAINRLGGWEERGAASAGMDPARAFSRTLQGFAGARVATAWIAIGIAQRAYEIALEYVKSRKQFGKEIGRFQLVQAMIADMATEIDAARLLAQRAQQLVGRRRCDAEVSMAKAYATEMSVRVASLAVQCMGANGLARENRVERCLRDARMWTMPDGTTQIQKLIIGRTLTGFSAVR